VPERISDRSVLEAAIDVPERACRFFVDRTCSSGGSVFLGLYAERAAPSGFFGPASGPAGFVWFHDAAA